MTRWLLNQEDLSTKIDDGLEIPLNVTTKIPFNRHCIPVINMNRSKVDLHKSGDCSI